MIKSIKRLVVGSDLPLRAGLITSGIMVVERVSTIQFGDFHSKAALGSCLSRYLN